MGADKYLNYIQTIRLDLLELFGSGYVIDHCISAFANEQEKIKRWEEEKQYRYYLTDCLKLITENTAKFAGGSYISNRYEDIIDSKPIIEKTGDEIASEIIINAGLHVKEGGIKNDADGINGENLS